MMANLKIKVSKTLVLLLFLGGMAGCTNNPYSLRENATRDYAIVPKPQNLGMEKGAYLLDNPSNKTQNKGDVLKKIDAWLSSGTRIMDNEERWKETFDALEVSIDSSITHPESYILNITPENVAIRASSDQGLFYAFQTLKQLITETSEGDLIIPAGEIRDSPRFDYRGMHLDVGRHFFEVDEVKEFLDILALHKINTFHWHLTEDQGWRIEIKKYPELTNIGAYRNGTIIGHFPGEGNDNERYGGFYTQEDIKEVVAYAGNLHIEVIPEIEMPGHSQAAIAAYPFLSCFPEEKTKVPHGMMSAKSKELQEKGTPKIVQESFGVYDDVYCAGNDSTFIFLQNVLDEVIPLFPSKYIHIGGDECPKTNWERCEDCQNRMITEGLEDEHELQSYFIRRMEKYVNSKGKMIIGWDEILEGGLAPNATVMSWRGMDGGIKAAGKEHDVIMTPTGYSYFDYYQSQEKENEPLAIGGYLPVEKVYLFDPVPEQLNEQNRKHILGAQGNMWTEYIQEFDKLQYMALPRMAALAEVTWTSPANKNWEDFQSRMHELRKIYDLMDLTYATHMFEKESN